MNAEQIANAVRTIKQIVAGGGSVNGAARQLAGMGAPPELLAEAQKQYSRSVEKIVEMVDPGALVEKETREGQWYAGPSDEHRFWPALAQELADVLPDEALLNVDNASNKIVGLLRPPGANSIRTRGLVLGHVQSGKTTSFMAVAAKAVDVGYRFVIVLSGVTENLRQQTQARLEEQLVGEMHGNWMMLTGLDHDFQEGANAKTHLNGQNKLLAVVKKNPYRLRRLAEWIESAGEAAQLSCPILIIDDEADQASIDVGKKRTSKINSLIRRLLQSPKSAYVAYTATPFANLLIDPSADGDLYPRDFVVSLDAGNGYYGPERLFGRDILDHIEDDEVADPDDVVRGIEDHEAAQVQPPKGKGAVYGWEPDLPPSLEQAIAWFFLATAARWARGKQGAHSSMLIHTSMLSESHFRMQASVEDHCADLAQKLASGNELTRNWFERLWRREADRVQRLDDEVSVSWSQVEAHLPWVVAGHKVVVDNFRSPDRLVYQDDEPMTCIAIGGNTLSRGLTLEGLVSSYFVRAASAYDTLLQMGRWFGYRNGYSDLVRIWMTDELRGWFRDLATVEAEIRREITRYETEGLRPSQLAVKIRTHPAMAVTAAAKMRASVQATMDYSSKREQTILFRDRDPDWLARNWRAAENLLEAANHAAGVEEGRVRRDHRFVQRSVPVGLIRDFLAEYQFHPDAIRLNSALLDSYIAQEVHYGGLASWTVVVMSNKENVVGARSLGPAGAVNLIRRRRMTSSKPGTANVKALAGPRDRAADLGDAAFAELGSNASDADIAKLREKLAPEPVLALYPIVRTTEDTPETANRAPLDAVDDVLGVTLYFPKAVGPGSSVTYVSADLSNVEIEQPEAELDEADIADEAAARAAGDFDSTEVPS